MANSHRMPPSGSTGEALALAAIFATPVFGGLLLGNTIDQWHNSQPTFTFGLLALGMTIGYYGLVTRLRRMNDRKR